ncbi:unnamed protein product [Phaedon cochleariae]|uniref:Armadillo repeat-containing protein 6 homolog n=1 Tax=Phaedon cochleariae TaxID=80249 RepID=A0A9N9SIQ9_PHACE|nr:unnamed protein product [Phaedon cochleariae]
MVLSISQETFNNAVQENITDLGLSPEEALEEAVTQFESQGVDLSSIIKELMISSASSANIEEVVVKLLNLNKKKASANEITNQLEILKTECDKGIQERVIAGKAGAYNAILDTLINNKNDVNIERHCLKAMISLMTKQPDLLDEKGIEIILSNLKKEADYDLKKLSLRWAKECCIMHEMNRQKIFDSHILENLKELLNDGTSDILRDVLSVFRGLVLDDDVRVEFGKAHDHARIIASEILCPLTGLLTRFRSDELLIFDLMLTVTSLMVRTEFCKKVEDAGGLDLIRDVMKAFPNNEKINRQCFKLLKSLGGNDDVRGHVIQKNLAPIIVTALNENKGNVGTAVAGLACISSLTLRSPENSRAFFDSGSPAVIVEVMKMYPDEKQIQKTASWAIRNMVCRSKYQSGTFIELGIEELLHKDLKKFKDIEYDIKAALRDLDCKVNLREEWTGKGGALTTGLSRE